jgi:hypothetical protein
MAFVTIRIKGVEGYSRTTLDKERLVVGRSSTSDLPIKHTSISREHFAFCKDSSTGSEQWLVEDLGSANGTRINETQVVGKMPLQEKDIVKAGRARMTFHLGRIEDAEAAIDIAAGDDDEPSAPVRKAGPEDPPEAIPCAECKAWFSIAHRLSGEFMACPHCGKSQIIPELAVSS